MGRRTPWIVGVLAMAAALQAQDEPPELRLSSEYCTELFASEPLSDHAANGRRATACIAQACLGVRGDATEITLALRVDRRGRSNARMVRGSLGERARDRCVTRVLGRTPFAARPGRARVTLDVQSPLVISTPSFTPPRDDTSTVVRPPRESVVTELDRVRPLVGGCLGEEDPDVAVLRLTFGADGRVQAVEPAADLSDAARRCVDRALTRNVRLPPFSDAPFTLVYPFRREAGDADVTEESLNERAARLPAFMRTDDCRAVVLGPPPQSVKEAVEGAFGCMVGACSVHFGSPIVWVDFEIELRGGRARARVDGRVSDREQRRCLERAIRHVPFPEGTTGHRRVRIHRAPSPPARPTTPIGIR